MCFEAVCKPAIFGKAGIFHSHWKYEEKVRKAHHDFASFAQGIGEGFGKHMEVEHAWGILMEWCASEIHPEVQAPFVEFQAQELAYHRLRCLWKFMVVHGYWMLFINDPFLLILNPLGLPDFVGNLNMARMDEGLISDDIREKGV